MIDPVDALREIGFWMERGRAETYRVRAFRRAADQIAALAPAQREAYERSGKWGELPGLGPKTVAVVTQSLRGEVPAYLQQLRGEATDLDGGGRDLRRVLAGDLHCHSNWSDGGSPVEEMMQTARALGHSYAAVTDHSPQLKVARGLSPARLREQQKLIDQINDDCGDEFRVLRGIEVDILDDGQLDQEPAMLRDLEVVVASVHSKLRMDSESMTHRMVTAIANPLTNVLGHCTGRLVEGARGTRPQSVFDAEVVFEACRQFNVAVEINSRPERQDPPDDLLRLARDIGCLFSIDTDAHAPGQLDWIGLGCARAQQVDLAPERIINTWAVNDLLEWCDKLAR